MTLLDITKKCIRPFGLVLFFISYVTGYVWGHIAGGFLDGRVDAYRET
jgi:hypothetical protein